MDPNAALRTIDDADRVDAETREVMAGLHGWLSRGGFAPDWVWLTVRDGVVVGVMGSDPKRYVGMPIDRARHVARHGGTGTSRRAHAAVAAAPATTYGGHAGHGTIGIGDIVRRSDREDKNRYVVVNIQQPWIYTRRISGSGGTGVITFPSELMLRKVS